MTNDLSKLSDRDLLAELRTFNAAVTASPQDYGLTAADADALKTDLNAFESELDGWDAINAQYDSQSEAKASARSQVLTRGRRQRKVARAHEGITGESLGSAGLAPYDDVRTDSPSPSSVPFALVDFGKLRHTINFRDKDTPDTDKKPDGMLGAEIWLKIGNDPPIDNTGCQYLATDTATPYVYTFSGADAGKTAWYLLRWVSNNGDKGDWSEAVGATVNG
jgi:hypothetical protein